MPILLIAEPSKEFSSALKDAFRDDYEVHTCSDGRIALELINSRRPDILIINLMLPQLDGLTVLRQIYHRPHIILALTNLPSHYVQMEARDIGIGYLMMLPCSIETIAFQLKEMQRMSQMSQGLLDLQEVIAEHLHTLGIPYHRDGYKQLCIAILYFVQNPTQNLTHELYPAVAKVLGYDDWRTVEHSMRGVISTAWNRRNSDVWDQYFPGCKGCPTIKRFLSVLTEKIKTPLPR